MCLGTNHSKGLYEEWNGPRLNRIEEVRSEKLTYQKIVKKKIYVGPPFLHMSRNCFVHSV